MVPGTIHTSCLSGIIYRPGGPSEHLSTFDTSLEEAMLAYTACNNSCQHSLTNNYVLTTIITIIIVGSFTFAW